MAANRVANNYYTSFSSQITKAEVDQFKPNISYRDSILFTGAMVD